MMPTAVWDASQNPFNPSVKKDYHAHKLYAKIYEIFRKLFAENPAIAATLGRALKEAKEKHNDKPLQEALEALSDRGASMGTRVATDWWTEAHPSHLDAYGPHEIRRIVKEGRDEDGDLHQGYYPKHWVKKLGSPEAVEKHLMKMAGMSRGASAMTQRTATVKVHRPTHVPKELHPVWHGAAVRLARSGRLLNRAGHVDYPAINRTYQRILAAYQNIATDAENDDVSQLTAARQPQRVAAPANWPFEDISPTDISRMAAAGRWDLVVKAARMATARRPVQRRA